MILTWCCFSKNYVGKDLCFPWFLSFVEIVQPTFWLVFFALVKLVVEVKWVQDYNLLARDEWYITWASWNVKDALVNQSFVKRYNPILLNKLVVSMLDLNIIVITVEKTNTEHLRPHPWPKHTHQWDDDKKIVVLLDNLFPGVELEVYVLAACWLYCGDQTIDNYLESEVECSNNNEMVYQFNF